MRRRSALAVVATAVVVAATGLVGGIGPAGAEPDDDFAGTGRWVVGDGYADRLVPLALPDGTVLAIGYESGPLSPPGDHGPKRTVLRVDRLDASGNLAPFTAGDSGALRVDVGDKAGFEDMVEPAGSVRLPDGRLIFQSPSPSGAHLIALGSTGALDTSFSGDGFLADDLGACRGVTDLAHSPSDGTLVAVAHSTGGSCQGTTVRKYDLAGNRLAPWGNAAQDGTAHDDRLYAASLAVAASGHVVVAGTTSGGDAVAIARLDASGGRDPSFGVDGLVTFDPDPARGSETLHEMGFHPTALSTTFATDVAIDAAGRIVVVGGSTTDASVDQWAARFLPDGSPDLGFGDGGIAWSRADGTRDIAFAVAVDSQDRLVVSGSSTPSAGPRHWYQTTLRLLPDGRPDPSFPLARTDHEATSGFGSGEGSIVGSVGLDQSLAGDGRVYVGGDTFYAYGTLGYVAAVDLGGGSPTTTATTAPPTTTTTTTTTTPPGGGAGFTPIPPARVLDTRFAGQGAPPVTAGADREVSLAGIVPPEAVAVVVNVTVTEPTASAFASVYPAGTAWPGTSTVNFEPGQTIANSVVVALGDGGRGLAVRVGAGAANVVLDVKGWYSASGFTARLPDRQYDSRLAGGRLGSTPQALQLRDVPAGATAVAVNLTATGADRDSYLAAWPSDGTEPHASLLNYLPGATVANGVILRLGPDGAIVLRNAAGHAHVVVDVMGWVIGDAYVPVVPERVVDTRIGRGGTSLGPGATGTFTVVPSGVDPVSVGAVAVNVTLTRPSAATFLAAWPTGSARPATSVINAATGQTIANGLVLGVADGQLHVLNSVGTADVLVDVLGWYPAG